MRCEDFIRVQTHINTPFQFMWYRMLIEPRSEPSELAIHVSHLLQCVLLCSSMMGLLSPRQAGRQYTV
jgi:hypothetical protein